MEKRKVEAIATEIIKYAKSRYENAVFVFGDEVYSLDEAKEAIIEYAADEIEDHFGGDADAYISAIQDCACEGACFGR